MGDEPFNRVDMIKHLVGKFEDVQNTYSSDGAYDSEPSWVFRNYIRRTVDERRPVTTIGACWELYDTVGASMASRALSKAADKVNEMVAMCNRQELSDLDGYYGWGLGV